MSANALQAAIAALGANTTGDGSLRSTPDNQLASLLQAQLANQTAFPSSSFNFNNPFGMGLAGGAQQALDLQQQLMLHQQQQQQQQQQAAALQQMQMMALLQQQQQQQAMLQQHQPSATTPTPAAATSTALDVSVSDVPAKSKTSCSPPAVQPASVGVSTAATLTTCNSPAVRDVDLVGASGAAASAPLGQISSIPSFNALTGGGPHVGGGGGLGGLSGLGLGSLLFGAGGGMNPSAAEILLAQQQQQQQQAMLVQFLQQQAMINALMSTLTSAPTGTADSAALGVTLAASSPLRPSLSIDNTISIAAAHPPILPNAGAGALLGCVSSSPSGGPALASASSAQLLPSSILSSFAPSTTAVSACPIVPAAPSDAAAGTKCLAPTPTLTSVHVLANANPFPPFPDPSADQRVLPIRHQDKNANNDENDEANMPSSSSTSKQLVVAALATGREKNSGISPKTIIVHAPTPVTATTPAVVSELFCTYCEHRTHTVEKCRYRLKKLEEVRIQEEKAKADAEAAEALRKQKADSIAKAKAEAEARLKQYKAKKAASAAAATTIPSTIVSPTSAPPTATPISGGTAVALPTATPISNSSAGTTATPTSTPDAAMPAASRTAPTSTTAQPTSPLTIVTSMVSGEVGSASAHEPKGAESDEAREKETENANDDTTTAISNSNTVEDKTKFADAVTGSNTEKSLNSKDKNKDDDDNCNTTEINVGNTNNNNKYEVSSDSEKPKLISPRQEVPTSEATSLTKHTDSLKEGILPVVNAAARTSVDAEKNKVDKNNIDEEATIDERKTPVSSTSPPRSPPSSPRSSPILEVSTTTLFPHSVATTTTTTTREKAVVTGEKRVRDRSRSSSRSRDRGFERSRRDRSRSRSRGDRDERRGRGGRSPSPSRRGDRDRDSARDRQDDSTRGGRRVERETSTLSSKRRQPRARSRSPRTLEREMKTDRERNRGKDEAAAEDHLPQRRFDKIVLDIGSCHPLCSYTHYTSSSSRTRDLRQRFDHIVRETSYTFTSHGSVSPFQGSICKEQRNELVNLMKSGRLSRTFDDGADHWMVRTVALVLLMIASAEKASEDGEARYKSYCASVRAHLENSYTNARAYPPNEPLELLWGRIWLHASRSLNVPVAPPAGLRYYVGSGVPGCRYSLPSSLGSGGANKAPPSSSSRDKAGGSRRL